MRLFLLPSSFDGSPTIELKGKDYNYLVNVLRLKEGSSVTGRDSEANVWNMKILSIRKNSVLLSTERSEENEDIKETTDSLPQNRPSVPIILYQCIPKGRKLDDIIRKATEIGVYAIIPVQSANCVADFTGKETSKTERYNTVVKEAIQQSGSLVPTKVFPPINISSVPSDFSKRCQALNLSGMGIFLHQCSVSENQSSLVASLREHPQAVALLIGSEGGFTDEECSLLLKENFRAVLLKTNILRCETASIYALSATQTLVETDC